MARAPKLRKVLVETRFGPAYRYVKDENIKRYGRIGKQEGESVYAKKQAVEFSKGRIQERAIASRDLEERYVKQYIPGEGYIWIRQDKPVSELEKPPEQKPQPEKPTILDVRPQDTITEMQRIESEERKARSTDPVMRAASGRKITAERDPFDDSKMREETRKRVASTAPAAEGKADIIPSAVEQAQYEEQLRRQERERYVPPEAQPEEERSVAITAIYKSQGVPIYDEQGNQMYDEEGKPLLVQTKFIKPSDVPLLYDPVISGSGKQAIDNQGRPLYRRKKAITSVHVAEAPSGGGSRVARQLPGEDLQIVLSGTFTDEDGKEFIQISGYSSTINGKNSRIARGESGYGGTGSEVDKKMEAINSLKRKLFEQGVDYETMDKKITEAIESGDLKFEYRRLVY